MRTWMILLVCLFSTPVLAADFPPDHPFARLRSKGGRGATGGGGTNAEARGVLVMEAEDMGLPGSWKTVDDGKAAGGRYVEWTGGNQYGKASKGKGKVSFQISKTGTYRFLCSMRQPDGVESDKCNDLWVQFSDAPMKDKEGKPLKGFVKVYGNSKGSFAYKGSYDVHGHKPQRGPLFVQFSAPGTYTLELAGRSERYQLDRVLLFHESVSQSEAMSK